MLCFLLLRPPGSTLFPYTTLFRSNSASLIGSIFFADGRSFFPMASRINPCIRSTVLSQEHCFDNSSPLRTRSPPFPDRKSTRLNSSHSQISYAVFCLKQKRQRLPT